LGPEKAPEHRVSLESSERNFLSLTKWWWLKNPKRMSSLASWRLSNLRRTHLKVGRAWALKETAMSLWDYSSRAWALKAWNRWYAWAIRSRLAPVKKVARMIKRHMDGIITAVVTGITNAASEAMNTQIQQLKRKAHGYRNRKRFRYAIYFHLGGLDLYPYSLKVAHTNS
jgi:transposase